MLCEDRTYGRKEERSYGSESLLTLSLPHVQQSDTDRCHYEKADAVSPCILRPMETTQIMFI